MTLRQSIRIVRDGAVGCASVLEQFGEGRRGAMHIHTKPSVVICRIERIVDRDDLPSEEPRQPAGIEIAALERFTVEMLDQRSEKRPISGPINRFAIPVPLTMRKRRCPFWVRTANDELEVRSRQTTRKPAMLQHGSPSRCATVAPLEP
ncbi:hypothetical protein [uncultured Jannaschia sp.]|uniref:hypothetical protein n=1 Tax=uncultured Jannaschia sp. TaxID=293347 RepID=UPI00345B6BBE